MTSELKRARIATAVSAILSAFVVFVSGGVIVLTIWMAREAEHKGTSVDHEVRQLIRAATSPAAEEPVRVGVPPAEAGADKAGVVETTAKPRKQVKAKPKEQARRSVKAKAADRPAPVPTEEPSPPPSEVREAPEPGGQGNVMFIGDHNRVRLMGGGLTFGAGRVPSGSYTIQATFPDSDPRNAGTLVVHDGDRLRVHCDGATQRCVRTR